MLSFTQYTQSLLLVKCSTIVSNRFTRLSFTIMRGSNSRPLLELRPTGGDFYVVCLAYVVRQFSLFKSDLPKVVNSCFPTIWACIILGFIPGNHTTTKWQIKSATFTDVQFKLSY